MNWYFHVLRQYARFSGRAPRAEFWWFTLFSVLAVLLAVGLDLALGTLDIGEGFSPVTDLYVLATLLPSLAVQVRRLHDIGRSGWWVLLNAVPAVGSLTLFVIATFNGQPGPNAFGPDPKRSASAPPDAGSGRGPSTAAAPRFVPWQRRATPRGRAVRALGVLLLGAAFFVGCIVFWWQGQAAQSEAAWRDGERAGRGLDEPACVAAAFAALRAGPSGRFDDIVLGNVHLAGCLRTSRPVANFCHGVPAPEHAFEVAQWSRQQCQARGLATPACVQLMQMVVQHCSEAGQRAGGAAV